jgi:hypothetical protein
MLAFKSTILTRWHINIPIPDIDALRERKSRLHFMFCILADKKPNLMCMQQFCAPSRSVLYTGRSLTGARSEPTETTLYALAKEKVNNIVVNPSR